MTILTRWLQGKAINAVDLRRTDGADVIPSSPNTPYTPRQGRTTGVYMNSGGLTVNVSDGWLKLASPAGGQGVYTFAVAGRSITLADAPSAGGRIDVVYATVPNIDDDAVIAVKTGTASSSPGVPSIPTGALDLAHVLVKSDATSVLTITQTYTGAPGAVLPVDDVDATDGSWFRPGQIIHDINNGVGPTSFMVYAGRTLTKMPLFDAMGGVESSFFNALTPTDNQASTTGGLETACHFTAYRDRTAFASLALVNADTVKVNRGGFYLVFYEVLWSTNAAGKSISSKLYVGDGSVMQSHSTTNIYGGSTQGFLPISLDDGDTISVKHKSNIGVAVNVIPELFVLRLGA